MVKRIKKLNIPNLDSLLTPKLIGEVIQARRTQSNLRLEDAAALCGVAKQTFMQVEHGHCRSQLGTVLQICSALGIQIKITPWNDIDEEHHDWE